MNNNEIVETVTICMPVLNEKDVIKDVLMEWLEIIFKLPPGSKILIDEGGSQDGTIGIIENLQNEYPGKITVLFQTKPDGFGNSAKRLLNSSDGYWVFFTDSDGQYVAQDFWKLWNRRSENDFIRGIKLGRQDPFIRRVASLFWNKSVNFLFELPVHDVNAAFLLIRNHSLKKILPSVRILPTMILSEIVIRCVLENLRFSRDIYINHRSRSFGKSRATPGLKFLFVGIRQIKGLFEIKKDYRIANKEIN
jgi:glycosyltransferase involved in cell wall biosynthesis